MNNTVTDLADPVMFADPFPRSAELRRRGAVSPAFSKQLMGGAGFMLTRHEDVLMLHNDVRFSSDPTGGESSLMMRHLPKMFRLLTNSMVYKDDPDHARLRRLVNKAFTPRMVQQMSGDIERIVHGLLDDLERRGNATVDLVADFATPLPLSVISTMLGVGDEDRDEFHVLMERFVARLGSGSSVDAVRAIPTARKLYAVLERLAEQRRAAPDDGLISGLLAANEDGDSLSDDEVIAMIFLLMLAGHDTTANLIGSSAVALIEHPEQAARLQGRTGIDGVGGRGIAALHDAGAVRHGADLDGRSRDRRHDDAQGVEGDGHDHFGQPGRGGVRTARRPRPRPGPQSPPHLRLREALLPGQPAGPPRGADRHWRPGPTLPADATGRAAVLSSGTSPCRPCVVSGRFPSRCSSGPSPATLPPAVGLPLVAAEITLILAPALGSVVPAPVHEGVSAVPTPVPAQRVAADRESTLELVDCF